MQSDHAEAIRNVADRIRKIIDGMCGSRYLEITDELDQLERIAKWAEGPRRPGPPVTIAHSRGRR